MTSALALPPGVKARSPGRPREYDRDILMPRILARLASGESIRQIARDDDMPPATSIREWGMLPEYSAQYARARDEGWESIADEILDIADDGTNDWTERETKSGRIVTEVDREHVSRSALRLDARKWLLSKRMPGIFGDRLQLDVRGAVVVAFGDLARQASDGGVTEAGAVEVRASVPDVATDE